MTGPLIPVQTVLYKTWVKETLVEALKAVFADHPDSYLARANVTVDFPTEEVHYPAVLVRFYERQINNAGVAHFEMLKDVQPPLVDPLPTTGVADQVVQLSTTHIYYGWDVGTNAWVALAGYAPNKASERYVRYKHYLYQGDIEFAVYTLSSYDRDLISDSLVQTIGMGDLEVYSDLFLERIYDADTTIYPYALEHFITINTDVIQGFGETQQIAPWSPEDVMVYQTSYRVGIHGEFYSRTPVDSFTKVQRVEQYPYYPPDGEPVPDPDWSGPDNIQGTGDDEPDPAPWSVWQ